MTPKIPRFHRQRFLLLLLDMAGGKLSKTDFQKMLFLSQKKANFSYYDFVPYHYDCYSFQMQSDIDLLESYGWLKQKARNIMLLAKPKACLKDNELTAIKKFTIPGKLSIKALNKVSYKKVHTEKSKLKCLYTIGYEGLSFESYANRLLEYDVRLLCDVRKNPLSRKFGFSKGILSRLLPKLNIEYRHLPDLGIQSIRRKSLHTAEDYEQLFKVYKKELPQKKQSLQLLEKWYNKYERIAIFCFEKAYHSCHRHCISDYLKNKHNIKSCHI